MAPGAAPVATPVRPGPTAEQEVREAVNEVRRELPRTSGEVSRLPLRLLLVLLGGYIGLGLGTVQFLLDVFVALVLTKPGHAFFAILRFVLDLVFGGVLLLAYARAKRDVGTGAVIAGVAGLVLLFLPWAGTVAGLLAVGGAALLLIDSGDRRAQAQAAATADVPLAIPVEVRVIEDVFIIHNDGRIIAHETRRLRPERDSAIMSGMLTAIQEFVKTAIPLDGDSTPRSVGEISYGEYRIVLEHGRSIFIAAVILAQATGSEAFRVKMRRALDRIEQLTGERLTKWDGDLSNLPPLAPILREELLR